MSPYLEVFKAPLDMALSDLATVDKVVFGQRMDSMTSEVFSNQNYSGIV